MHGTMNNWSSLRKVSHTHSDFNNSKHLKTSSLQRAVTVMLLLPVKCKIFDLNVGRCGEVISL